MYGAIIGDLAGSIYEYDQVKRITKINDLKELITKDSFYSDDTILTVAIADAILHNCNYEEYLKKYGKEYMNYKPNVDKYFKYSFSPGFIKWIKGNTVGNSIGNGAMMRISPVGYMFDNLEQIKNNAFLATIPSHNDENSIKCATLIASIIFFSRNGMSKQEILDKLDIKLKYNEFTKFNTSCIETIDNCLYALFNSNSFEEALRLVISYGGDTDTNACIVGSMAEAMYGVKSELIDEVNAKIPDEFVKVLKRAYNLKK